MAVHNDCMYTDLDGDTIAARVVILYDGHVMRVVLLRLGMYGDSDQPDGRFSHSFFSEPKQ